MKIVRAGLVAIACFAATLALAQWQWLDSSGRKVFSDQPPPPGTPPEKILKQPGGRAAEPEPAQAASAAAPAAPAPKVSGRDKVLDEKRRAAAAAEAEKRKSEETEVAKSTAENCQRARESRATLDAGTRLSQVNARGERVIMDDAARAAERQRLDEVIKRDCPH
jgi:type IV secretory pathway VirB10-like protein